MWSEIKQLWDVGLQEYVHDMWNVIDFATNAMYVATVALRVVAYYQVRLCYFYFTLELPSVPGLAKWTERIFVCPPPYRFKKK